MEDKELVQLIQRGRLDISLEELKELNPHKCKKCRKTYFGSVDGKPIPCPYCKRHEQSNKDAKIKTERDQARLDLAEAVGVIRKIQEHNSDRGGTSYRINKYCEEFLQKHSDVKGGLG